MTIVHLVDVPSVNKSSALTRAPWKLDAKNLQNFCVRDATQKKNNGLSENGPSIGREGSIISLQKNKICREQTSRGRGVRAEFPIKNY